MSEARAVASGLPRIGIAGVGLLAPGLDGWAGGAPLLADDAPFEIAPMRNPAPSILPGAERRRASLAIRLALEVAQQAVADAAAVAADLPCVFTSCDGDGDTIHAVCTTLTEPGYPVSPTRFSNSVHNAPAGYWSIAVGARKPSTSLCGFEASFAVGLLEACTQIAATRAPLLLVASDVPLPPPLAALHPTYHPCGAALVLVPEGATARHGSIGVTLSPDAQDAPWPAAVPAALRANASAQALRLLAEIAARRAMPLAVPNGAAGQLALDYRP